MSARGYDPECGGLARYFIGELAAENHPHLVPALSQAIQDAVEEWLKSEMHRIAADIKGPNQ